MKEVRQVSPDSEPVSTTREVVKKLDDKLLQRRMRGMYQAVSPNVMPRYLRQQPSITGLSPSFGAGIDQDYVNRRLVVHIDEEFLDNALAHIEPRRGVSMVGHFILSAVGHGFIKYRPEVSQDKSMTPNEVNIKMWRWASALAFKEMNLRPDTSKSVLLAYRQQARIMEIDHGDDMLMVLNEAKTFNVDPPKLSPVPAWTAVGFPQIPSELA